MLKFILLVLVFYLLFRMAGRLLRGGLFFYYGAPRHRENSSGSSASPKRIEETDYEVIESHLPDKERDVV
ncbi:hypothetical protein [Chlorobium ferrooxidans]|uniref:hypothetical protein n=1 Tax=Chlorobium ferrooxidans TaxID=84205 RepID=UPI000314BF3B|nr:hypothetical protein [Chlorobium ferrooxidans]